MASGFFYDSLLDQFDLEKGLTAGRGLLRVDFHGQERRRKYRDGAIAYGKIVKSGRLPRPAARSTKKERQ